MARILSGWGVDLGGRRGINPSLATSCACSAALKQAKKKKKTKNPKTKPPVKKCYPSSEASVGHNLFAIGTSKVTDEEEKERRK